jgi:FkbM family methyltransferase
MATDLLNKTAQPLGLYTRAFQMEYPEDREQSVRRVLTGQDFPLDELPAELNPRIIVDIGSACGASALYFHSHFPDAQVVCYEPSVYNFPFLETNTEGIANITNVHCALSNETGIRPLFYGAGPKQGTFSLLEFTENRGREMVEVRRASEEFRRRKLTQISILKISAEAAEMDILVDLFENLPELNILFLFVEYHGGSVRDLLVQLLGREYEHQDLHQVGKRHATMQFANRSFLKWLDRQKAA